MAIIQFINGFYKKNVNFLTAIKKNKLIIFSFNPLIIFSLIVFFLILFFITSNLVSSKNKSNRNNIKQVTSSNEFSNLANYFISKINSPYEEVDYLIKNNDTVEKILKNFNIKNSDIKNPRWLLLS